MSTTLTLEYELPHPPRKVWRALTEPKLLARWLMETDLETAAVGRTFKLRGEATQWWDGVVHCEVREMELHKRIAYTWKGGSGAAALDTVVTWTLTETKSGGTLLKLEQAGFSPKNAFAAEGAKQGWDRLVGERMRELLATEA
jgi:uncharacterized protein YndB with AHSA1/START domain